MLRNKCNGKSDVAFVFLLCYSKEKGDVIMNLGENIKKIRIEKNMKQKDLAEKSTSQVYQLVNMKEETGYQMLRI